ncbi:exosome complex protein Rrp42 [Candidatus Pacearchaeota archaeon]|nr:exosome complex protein Rrp42 [Candidatus Pacearchaeota archaeon]
MSSMKSAGITIDTFKKLFTAGKRFDGRGLMEYRPFEVNFEVSNCAEGSARVRLGKSEVIVGVKMNIDKPYPDSPDKGNLMVSADLLPLASPRFEAGPPKFDAIELPRLVDRAIRESGMINLKELVVTPGEKVWTVIIDIYPINADGNLIDAASIGAAAALKSAVIPGITEAGTPDYKHRTKKKLPLSDETLPLSITVFKLGNTLFLDPTREEEEASETRTTFGVSKWKGSYMINSCQKSAPVCLTRAEIEEIAKLLPKKYDELNERLKKFL